MDSATKKQKEEIIKLYNELGRSGKILLVVLMLSLSYTALDILNLGYKLVRLCLG